jgi:catechol 2,3-dioxygenase-like lactoylglutathione lyase family enzyme
MSTDTRFSAYDLVAFAATAKPNEARTFYRDTLGLPLVDDDQFAMTFDAKGTTLRVTIVEKVAPAPYTVLGWRVPDITAAVQRLKQAGVRLQRYPGMDQDEDGIWTAPNGTRVAWFNDPDGNTLSVSA